MDKNKTENINILKYDDHNFNKHTDEGKKLLEKSLQNHKFGRSILVDKDNNIIAGNGIVETAKGLGMDKIKVVETKGDELVVVKRTDVDINTQEGREMALADNATSATDLSWSEEELAFAEQQWDIDLTSWNVDVLSDVDSEDFGDEFSLPNEGKSKYGTMTFSITEEQREFINFCVDIAKYCEGYNEVDDIANENGASLYFIAKEWFKENDTHEDFEKLKEDYDGLKTYLRDALAKSGQKASDIDRLLGTNGMSGHYFGDSQWMFPTREAYERMREVMPLDRDYFDCKLAEKKYMKALKIRNYGQM